MYSRTTGEERQPLLPQPLESGLFGLASRLAGAGLIAVDLFCWLALLSWSAQDPSLTYASGGSARNWMGASGAVTSDLLLQTLGLASLFALLAPAVWGFDCLARARLVRVRWKMALVTLAVLMLAGGLAALPVPSSWPLHHGLGGMIGDLVYRLAASLLGVFNPARAGAAAGLLLLAGGMSALASGLGISYQDMSNVLRQAPRIQAGSLSGLWQAASKWGPMAAFGRFGLSDTAKVRSSSQASEPTLDLSSPPTWNDHATNSHPPPIEPCRPPDFDMETDRTAAEMADRYANAAAARRRAAAPLPPGPDIASSSAPADAPRQSPPGHCGLEMDAAALRGERLLLQQELANLGVRAQVTNAHPGPVVTEFEVDLEPGVRAERVESLADEIALAMNAEAARVSIAQGGMQLAIELANARREPVVLRDLVAEAADTSAAVLPVILGRSCNGAPMVVDLVRLHSLFVAGAPASGRSATLGGWMLSLAHARGAAECQLLLIDPRQRQSALTGLPHLLSAPVTNAAQGVAALGWIVDQMNDRLRRFSALGVDDIDAFNDRVREARNRGVELTRTVQTGFDRRTGLPIYEREVIAGDVLARVVVVVDELADLMAHGAPEVEDAIRALSDSGRSAGIHLIVGTDRPTIDVLTPAIAGAISNRVAFRTSSRADSRTIIGGPGAERLLGDGDMLLVGTGGSIFRVHGAAANDEEMTELVAALGHSARRPEVARSAPPPDRDHQQDALYDKVVAVMSRFEMMSAAMLAGKLGAGRSQIEGVLARLLRQGVIQSSEHRGWYKVAANPVPRQRLRA